MSLLIPHHLCVPSLPTLSLFFFCLGLCVYRLVAKPCAHILQIQAGVPRRAQPNDVLERVFQSKTVHKALACSVVHQTLKVVTALEHTTTVIMIHSVNAPCDVTVTPTCIVVFKQVITICPLLSSLVSGHKAIGGTLQAAGLGCTENTEMVSRPSDP